MCVWYCISIHSQGCDASILIEPSGDQYQQFTELDSAKNFGIRKRELVGEIKTSLETECPKQVSCSDIIILAAREAVALTGGPLIAVPLGRKDSLSTPSKHVADSELPPSTADVDSILSLFAGKAMTVEESVAIMGIFIFSCFHKTYPQSIMGIFIFKLLIFCVFISYNIRLLVHLIHIMLTFCFCRCTYIRSYTLQ